MLYTVLLVTEVLLSVSLITLILMQHGKGADAGAAFGGGASGTVFGSKGSANFLSRTTGILATAFFINCMMLAYIVANKQEAGSVVDSVVESVEPAAPVVPVDAPADIPVADAPPAASDVAPAADMPAADVPETATQTETPVSQPQDIPSN